MNTSPFKPTGHNSDQEINFTFKDSKKLTD